MKRLYRSKKDKVLGGVCGGIADYLGVDPVIVRLVWILVTIASLGFGLIAYVVAWLIVPEHE